MPSKGEESRQASAWLKIPAMEAQKNQTTEQSAFIQVMKQNKGFTSCPATLGPLSNELMLLPPLQTLIVST